MEYREGWATGMFRLKPELIPETIQEEYLKNEEVLRLALQKKHRLDSQIKTIVFKNHSNSTVFDQVKDLEVLCDAKARKIDVSYNLRYSDSFRPKSFMLPDIQY